MPSSREKLLAVLSVVLLSGACTADRISGPKPGQVEPEVVRAIRQSGVGPGPVAVTEIREPDGHTRFQVMQRKTEAEQRVQSGATLNVSATGSSPLFVRAPDGPYTNNALDTIKVGWRIYCVIRSSDGNSSLERSYNADILSLVNLGVEDTGGHLYTGHTAPRPEGRWFPASGSLNADGVFPSTFRSSQVSGEETIEITYRPNDTACAGQTGLDGYRAEIQIPGLVRPAPTTHLSIGTSWRSAHDYIFAITPEVESRLHALAREFYDENGYPVTLTSVSLTWGGLYDTEDDYQTPHLTHRIGTDVDLTGKDTTLATHRKLVEAGRFAGFRKCERHPVRSLNKSHVHCYGNAGAYRDHTLPGIPSTHTPNW